MKTVLSIFGVFFLILVLVIAVLMGYYALAGPKLDASSKAYVDASIPAIITTWSRNEFIKRESPQLRKSTPDEQVGEFFTKLTNQLGSFQTYDGAKGDANISYTSENGEVITASYVANATFQNGKIDIQIKLIQVHGEWMYLGFHVAPHPAERG